MTTVLPLTFNPVSENTYIVYDNDSREAIIFDPGCFTNAEEAELSRVIEDLKLKPVKLVNTHCHFDHVLGNDYVMKKYNLKLGIHELEREILESAPVVVNMYGLPPMTPSPPATNIYHRLMNRYHSTKQKQILCAISCISCCRAL